MIVPSFLGTHGSHCLGLGDCGNFHAIMRPLLQSIPPSLPSINTAPGGLPSVGIIFPALPAPARASSLPHNSPERMLIRGNYLSWASSPPDNRPGGSPNHILYVCFYLAYIINILLLLSKLREYSSSRNISFFGGEVDKLNRDTANYCVIQMGIIGILVVIQTGHVTFQKRKFWWMV